MFLNAKRVVYDALQISYISGSKIVAACHNTSIRISEIFNVDKKVRLLFLRLLKV